MPRLMHFARCFVAAAPLFLVAVVSDAAELECASEPVTARGPGFSPSPQQSAEAAKEEWLKKATTFYSDATWETAKEPAMVCVNQGLYSNCKITAVPCGTTPAAKKED